MAGTLFDLQGKIALVTGGSRGIGSLIARGLLQAGAEVFIVARNAKDCSAMEKELSAFGPCRSLVHDLSDMQSIRDLAQALAGRTAKLDILVNNAGATYAADVETYPELEWNAVFNVNLKAPFFLLQCLLPLLRAGASRHDPSRVINIGSIAGMIPMRRDSYAYAASKAGLHHLTRHLARRLAGDQITVNAVAPGAFATQMITFALKDRSALEAMVPLGSIGDYEDIAGVIVFLASRAGAYVTGAVIPADGGMALTGG